MQNSPVNDFKAFEFEVIIGGGCSTGEVQLIRFLCYKDLFQHLFHLMFRKFKITCVNKVIFLMKLK